MSERAAPRASWLPIDPERRLAFFAALAALFWISGAVVRKPYRQESGLAVVLAALALGLCIVHRRRLASLLRGAWPALAVVPLAFASTLWSVDPASTWREACMLLVTTVIGLGLAAGTRAREQLALVALVAAAAAAIAVLVVVLDPDQGLMKGRHAGAWRGSYHNRNHLAPVALLGVWAGVLLVLQQRGRPAFAVAVTVLCGIVTLATRSRGAWLLVVGVLLAVAVLSALHRADRAPRRRIFAALAVGLGGGLVALSVAGDALLAALGRDLTLSGRTQIWALSLDSIAERPWLGYGFAAFWNHTPPARAITEELNFYPFHAHNGLVELALDLGILGLLLFAGPFLVVAVRSLRSALGGTWPAEAWYALYLLHLGLFNLVEPLALQSDRIFWALYVMAAVGVSRPRALRRSER